MQILFILSQPILNILLFFYFIISRLGVPGAFGFSIIGLTVFIRLLLHPLFHKQLMMAKKMEKMKPHLDSLTAKHKDDKKRLQEEQLKLYKEMGVNPASGCLTMLIQMPVIIGLYKVLGQFFGNGKAAAVAISAINNQAYLGFLKLTSIDPTFFGLNLGVAPSQFHKYGVYYLLIPVITAILQYYQVVVATPKNTPSTLPAVADQKDKKSDAEDMQKIMTTQMKFIFPIMIGYISYTLPIGMALYWNIFSIFTIIQYTRKIDI